MDIDKSRILSNSNNSYIKEHTSGPCLTLLFSLSPSSIFQLFSDNETINFMVDETNKHYLQNEEKTKLQIDLDDIENKQKKKSHMKEWEPTTPTEMKIYLAIMILMGIHINTRQRGIIIIIIIIDHWSQDGLYNTDYFFFKIFFYCIIIITNKHNYVI
jgi:hypothetical protein